MPVVEKIPVTGRESVLSKFAFKGRIILSKGRKRIGHKIDGAFGTCKFPWKIY
jgi:hypothetical protein